MVGLIIVGIALLTLVLLVLFALWKPGPEQRRPGTAPEAREGEQW
jgi:hypothetical protein